MQSPRTLCDGPSHFFNPVLSWIFKACKAIPIAPARESETIKEQAFASISEALRDSQLVCIFPEGMITYDGQMHAFKPGVERILNQDPVPVIPMAIGGLWGSFFSRKNGAAMKKLPKPSHRTINVVISKPVVPPTTASQLQDTVGDLLREINCEAA